MKIISFGIVFFVFSFLYTRQVYAYDTFIGHAGLTELSAKLYNSTPNSHPLSNEQIQWLKQGATEEDTPFRWMNHFYDPVHKQGLKGEFLTSKEWANNQAKQARYSKGDHTWDRALFDYHKGLEKDAFIALGHVLHLIEDATVPAHTRDDAHPAGDPFENWVKDHWPIDVSKTSILKLKDLDAYFDNVANFSNNNFYSEDTIEDKRFKITESRIRDLDVGGNEFTFNMSKLGNREYYLFRAPPRKSWRKKIQNNNDKITVNDPLVLSDYSSFLVPKTVSAGAGVISLFFDTYETEPQKKVLLFQTHPLGVAQEALVDAGYGTIDTWNKFKNSAQDLYQEVKQNFWQITDMLEAAKISYNIFKVNAALAATFDPGHNQNSNQFSLFQRVEQKTTPQDASGQASGNKQTSKKGNSASSGGRTSSIIKTKLTPAKNTQKEKAEIVAEPPTPISASSPRAFLNNTPTKQQTSSGGSSSSGSTGGGTGSISTPNSTASNSAPDSQSQQTGQSSFVNNQSASNTPDASASDSLNATSTVLSSATSTLLSSASSTLVFLDPPTINTPTSTIVLTSSASTTSSMPSVAWTALSSIILSGMKSASSTAIFVNQKSDDVILTTSTWSAPALLQNGENIFNVFAQDAEGSTSTATSTIIWRDSEPPTSALIVVSTSTAVLLGMDITWSAVDALSGVAYFDIQIASSTPSASSTPLVWQEFLTHTTSTAATFSGIDGITYYFRMRATDNLGNTSDWTSSQTSSQTAQSFTPALSHAVVINEIAWSGTKAGYNDEWMELMNTGGTALDLTGFRLTDGNNDIDITFATGTIPAYGYWLLARTTSTTVSRMGIQGWQNGGLLSGTADGGINLLLSTGPKMRVGTIYSGSLKDDGETLSLFDAQEILIDHIDASAGWFAGAKKTSTLPPRSMQRIDPRASGELASNWETNNGTLINGSDALMNSIFGTPLQPNRGYTTLSGTLASSTVLTAKNSPYHLFTYTIPSGATLTIEPGAVIKAYNVSLVVDGGTLNAVGNTQYPIVFTSVYDTEYGAPPLDYAPSAYHADYWQGIAARNNGSVSLNHAIMTKGGYNTADAAVIKAESAATITLNNLSFQDIERPMLCAGFGSAITMTNSTIKGPTYGGALANDCSLDISQSDLSDIHWGTANNSAVIFGVEAHRSAIRLNDVSFQDIRGTGVWLDKALDGTLIRNSSVSDSPTGIIITDGTQTVDNMVFKNLALGIKQTGFATTTFQNMTNQNFTDVITTTTPAGLF